MSASRLLRVSNGIHRPDPIRSPTVGETLAFLLFVLVVIGWVIATP